MGHIFSLLSSLTKSCFMLFIASELDKEVEVFKILPVSTMVKLGPTIAEYWVQLLRSGRRKNMTSIFFMKQKY